MTNLPSDHLLVPFAYAATPRFPALKRIYEGGVSPIYESGSQWQRHASAIVLTSPGDHIVWLAAPPCEVLDHSEEIIAWARDQRTDVAPHGYRPIMGQNELLDLHSAHPRLFWRLDMVALGSFVMFDRTMRYVANLHANIDDDPVLDCCWCDDGWDESSRFPLVPRVIA